MKIIGDTKYDVKLTLLVVIILCTPSVHVHCTADVQGRWMLNNISLIEDKRLFVISSVFSIIRLKQENGSEKKSNAWIGL